MLTFFRHIRKSLLHSSQVRKYSLYAIGEIALVVIGILIALQVNNWNQHRFNESKEQGYLLSLKSDFQKTKNLFETNKWEHQNVKSAMEQLLHWAEVGGLDSQDHLKFDSLLSNVFYRSSFDPPLGTVETILGSGNVDLITNKKLVSLLTQWTSRVDHYRYEETRAVDHFYQTIYPFLLEKINLQDLDKGIPTTVPWPHGITNAHQLISNQEFHNIIYVHWVIQWNILDRYAPNIDDTVDDILELIDEDLDM